jgi:Mor family transcriptional regulator
MQSHDHDPDPDIVAYTLQCVLAKAPGFDAALAKKIEEEVKAKFGGRRLFLPKGAKRLSPEQRAELYKDGLTSMPDEVLIEKYKISKTTLWRVMKSAGGRFSS